MGIDEPINIKIIKTLKLQMIKMETNSVKNNKKRHFDDLSDEDLELKKIKVQKKNTVKADKSSEAQFMEFLHEQGVEM